jgi:succinyl-diaminopimelate desuccinylase
LKEVTGVSGKTSTSGGTSDGRFLSAAGADVIELGPSFKTIHKVNEQVAIGDLECLVKIYKNLLERVCIQ